WSGGSLLETPKAQETSASLGTLESRGTTWHTAKCVVSVMDSADGRGNIEQLTSKGYLDSKQVSMGISS
ncbi:hypothetical protein ACQP3C_31295, partial [Escherichia coli]